MSDPLLEALKIKWGNTKSKSDDSPDTQEGDFDLDNSIDKKIKDETHRKLLLTNEQTENNLIPKKMIQAVIGDLSYSIQSNLVDLPRRDSAEIAAILGVPEKERDLENILQKKIKTSIAAIKARAIKLLDDGTYE